MKPIALIIEAELVAAKLKGLKLAHECEFGENGLEVPSLVADLLSPEKRDSFLEPFASLKKTGVQDSANFLTKLWGLETNPQ